MNTHTSVTGFYLLLLQEAQRAAKQEKKDGASAAGPKQEGSGSNVKKETQAKEGSATSAVKKEPKRVPDHLKADDAETQKRVAKRLEKQHLPQRTVAQRKVRLFNHLHQYEREVSLTGSFS